MYSTIDQTLIVGASGRVGRLLARAWRDARPCMQHRGAGLDWQGPQLHWHPLSGAPLPQGFAAMIVLAGVVRGDLSLNAALAGACLAAAQATGIPKVLLASSSAVYGVNDGHPCSEDTPTHPVNAYGHAKLAAESVADRYRAAGMAVTVLRIGNVAGAGTLLTNAARPLLIDRFASGQGPRRSYIGAQGLARVLSQLVQMPTSPVLNIASTPLRMEELVQAAGLPWQYRPAPVTAYENITLDCSRLAALMPMPPQTAAQIVAEWQACR